MPADQKRKRSRSRSHGLENDDLNYIDEESDLSSGDDAFNFSDADAPSHDTHPRKRGRPKSQYQSTREESKNNNKFSPTSYSSPLQNQTYMSNNYESDIDESGEQKVDKFGRLLGGREYRVATFKLPTRGEQLFMFSKDPAALLGFRDSFVFLKKNTKLVKVHIDNVEKGYLVDMNLLRSTFRTREISVVTARSVFKQFGHRVIRRGRKGRDDYYYTEEVDEDENDPSEDEHNTKDTTERSQAPSHLPTADIGKHDLSHKPTAQDTQANGLNWMHNAAISIRQFNASISSYRRHNPMNYDLLTNVYQIPESRQTFIDNDIFLKQETNTLNNNMLNSNTGFIPNQFTDDFMNTKMEIGVNFQ